MNRTRLIALAALIGLSIYAVTPPAPPDPTPKPKPAPAPTPKPKPKRPCPGPGPCPSPMAFPSRLRSQIVEGGVRAPDGTELTCDLPRDQRRENISSKGLGCCVFRSADHSGRYQNVKVLENLPEWMKSKGIEGGGYPEKVDTIFAKLVKDKGVPDIRYIQYEGRDLNVLRKALATGRMPCVTYYGRDGVHYKSTIAHMVNLVHLDDKWACIQDNNFVEDDQFVWMTPAEFVDRWAGRGNGWAVVLLAPPPPPPPTN